MSYEKEWDCQPHVHELQGPTAVAGECPHTHRFATVTGEEIPVKGGHIHKILARTDFFFDHYHIIRAVTGPDIYVGCGKHVHFIKDVTSFDDGHKHKFQAATFIEDPLLWIKKKFKHEEYDD